MRKAIALFWAFALGWPAVALCQRPDSSQADSVAVAALSTLRELASQLNNYRELGFDSPEDMSRASIGAPYRIFMVRLDELSAYRDDQDPNELLHERNQLLYPVVIGDTVRSSVSLTSKPEGWEATSFGAPNRMRLLSNARALSIDTTRLSPAAYFVVEVPGLKRVFVGYRADQVLMLTPVLDDADLRFQTGVAMPADRVFAMLRVAARSRMNLPG